MNLPECITLRDGRACSIERLMPNRAGAYRRYQTVLAQESLFITTQPHEIKQESVLAAQARLFLDKPGHIWLVLRDDSTGEIVADCMARAGGRERMCHVATVGVGVLRSHQRQGVAKGLMERIIDWATSDTKILKLHLSMFESNKSARALYELLGFGVEGQRAKSYRGADGNLVDEVLMGRWVGAADEHG
jgi:RimJ/RimL family protein N-acetyltransferase